MSIRSAKITLQTATNRIAGWNEFFLRKSMNELTCSFALSASDFTYGNLAQWGIKLGDEVKVLIDDTVVCIGYIDNIPLSYSKKTHFIQFCGRGKTADLVDCTYNDTANEFRSTTIKAIIENICSPFSLTVAVDSSATGGVTKQVTAFKIYEGDYCYLAINELCKDAGVLAVDKGDGKLTLLKATTSDFASDSLQFGLNVVEAFYLQNNIERYGEYKIIGQDTGAETKSLRDYITPTATKTDSAISRTRPLTILTNRTDQGRCRTRAAYEARTRAGNSRALFYTVSSFLQKNNKVWDINKLVKVKDDFLQVDDTLLISEVEFRMTPELGQQTLLTVVDKDTYSGSSADINIKTVFDA